MEEPTVEIHPQQPTGVEMVGPFEDRHWQVTSDGYRIPYLESWPVDPQGLEWEILVDRRLVYRVPQSHLDQIVPLLADAMAVAAGYKSHQNACDRQQDRHNPFGTRMMRLGNLPTEEEQHMPGGNGVTD